MSTATMTTIDTEQILGAMEKTQGLLERAWRALKTSSTKDGRVSGTLLDERQLESYNLALSTAELTAARFVLDYAANVRKKRGEKADGLLFEERLALLFASEAIQAVHTRLAESPEDYGLTGKDLGVVFGDESLSSICRRHLSARNQAELGQRVREQKGRLGDYLLNEDHEMMRDTFRRFATDVVMPLAEKIHRDDLIIPAEILGPLTEMGAFGLSIPERFGGLQPDDREDNMGMIVVTEELSRGSLGGAGSLITRPEILSKALLKGGTETQKETWLPKLASGETLCAVAVTEPDYGSDVAAMKFKATRTDTGWMLNGAKSWCTFGGKAEVLLVLARTNPDAKLGHKGLSMFLVEKPSFDGHEFEVVQPGGGKMAGRAIATIGYRGMHSFDVFFEDWHVGADALLGGEAGLGKGFYFTMAGFAGGRIQTAARAVGVMQTAFEKAATYADDRQVFGKAVADFALTKSKLARMAARLVAARQFTYGVARLMDKGEGAMEASMVKLFAGRSAEWLTREAMQIHGGMGYAEETDVSRYFLDARVLSIFEGAEETLALKVIARSIIDSLDA
jgi:(2S)-methylsuccinyl-CoA dehydrogenase